MKLIFTIKLATPVITQRLRCIMKRILFVFSAVLLIIILAGCHSNQKSKLKELISQEVKAETVYTTASYENYKTAIKNAQTAIKKFFVSSDKLYDARKQLQFAIDNLKIATKGVYCIEYEFTLISNDSVGNSWEKSVICNKRKINSGDIINAPLNSSAIIKITVTETGSVPDIGTGRTHLTLKDGVSSSIRITVQENRGRYTGNVAIWGFRCWATLIERI